MEDGGAFVVASGDGPLALEPVDCPFDFVDLQGSLAEHACPRARTASLDTIRAHLNAQQGAQPVLLFIEGPGDSEPSRSAALSMAPLLFSLRTDDPLPAMVERVGLPAIFDGRPAIGSGRRSHIYTYGEADNRGVAREAVRHLLSLGRWAHRRHHRPPRPGHRDRCLVAPCFAKSLADARPVPP